MSGQCRWREAGGKRRVRGAAAPAATHGDRAPATRARRRAREPGEVEVPGERRGRVGRRRARGGPAARPRRASPRSKPSSSAGGEAVAGADGVDGLHRRRAHEPLAAVDQAGRAGGAERDDRAAGACGDQPAAELQARGGEALRPPHSPRPSVAAPSLQLATAPTASARRRRARLREVHLDEVGALAQRAGELRAGGVDHHAVAGGAQGAAERAVEPVARSRRRGAVDDRPLAGPSRPGGRPPARARAQPRRRCPGRARRAASAARPPASTTVETRASPPMATSSTSSPSSSASSAISRAVRGRRRSRRERRRRPQRAQRARHVGALAAGLLVGAPGSASCRRAGARPLRARGPRPDWGRR